MLLGYPPFVKDVIDTGLAARLDWPRYSIKLVLAGEVFSEEWRDLVGARAGLRRSGAGTRRRCTAPPTRACWATRRRFGVDPPVPGRSGRSWPASCSATSRLPTLVQYDPASRFFEVHDGTLLFSGDSGVPLIRYHIADEGGARRRTTTCSPSARDHGFDPLPERRRSERQLPFVYVFGRSLFTVSFFGANVYPENVTVGLEQPGSASG